MQDLTLKETAKLLSVSYGHIFSMCRDGKFPAYKVGRVWRVNPEELEKFRRGEFSSKPNPKQETQSWPCSSVTEFTTSGLNSKVESFTKALNKARGNSR